MKFIRFYGIWLFWFLFVAPCHAQWEQIETPIFIDPSGFCVATYSGDIGSHEQLFWVHDISCVLGEETYYKIFKSNDGGLTWVNSYGGYYFTAGLKDIHFISEDTGYLIQNNYSADEFIYTVNGFGSVQSCSYPWFPALSALKMIDSENIYGIYKWFYPDSSYFFTELVNDTFNLIYEFPDSLMKFPGKMEITQNQIIYLSCRSFQNSGYDANMILKSNLNSLNWDSSFYNPDCSINSIKFYSDSLGFAVGKNGMIIKTENAGTSWQSLTSNVNEDLISLDYQDAETWVAAGSSGTIIYSKDGGTDWIPMISPTTGQIKKIKFPEKDEIVFILSSNHIWKGNINLLTQISSNQPNEIDIQVFPNPAKNYVLIELKTITVPKGKIELINSMGMVVHSLELKSSTQLIHLDAFREGLYFIKLSIGNKRYVERVIIQ